MSGESLRERSRRNQQRDSIRTDARVRRACGDTRNFIKWNPAAAKLSLRESEKENKEGEEEEATPRIGDTARFVCVRGQKHFVCTRLHCSCSFVLRSFRPIVNHEPVARYIINMNINIKIRIYICVYT
jgi:hypothetical protein